jgi:hypothetical protein
LLSICIGSIWTSTISTSWCQLHIIHFLRVVYTLNETYIVYQWGLYQRSLSSLDHCCSVPSASARSRQ